MQNVRGVQKCDAAKCEVAEDDMKSGGDKRNKDKPQLGTTNTVMK